jgi:CheY-like chemotaxis protein
MVHGLAAQLGGMLELRSEPGRGTTAEIWLPVAEEQPVVAPLEPAMLHTAVGRATILLVDDEDLVRAGTADMLRDIGYEVITAASGAEAIRLLRAGAEVDLLITDYLMPAMNGVQLVHLARSVAPNVPSLLITGYSTIAAGPDAMLPRLAKPFRQADLASRVAELLRPAHSGDVVSIDSKREADSAQR